MLFSKAGAQSTLLFLSMQSVALARVSNPGTTSLEELLVRDVITIAGVPEVYLGERSAERTQKESILSARATKLSVDQTGALKLHNDGRKAKGLKALVWDAQLTKNAQTWANHLVAIDSMTHSTSEQRPGQGENLAWAWSTEYIKYPMTQGAQSWMDEAKDYHGEIIPQGNFELYGHYTQCMWNSTTKVGIAAARNSKGAVYTVARYSAPGNWQGQTPYI